MSGQDFLSIADLTPDEVEQMVTRAGRLKAGETSRPLEGKTIALLFEKPSLRTRVSFEVGVRQLGGDCIYLSRDDVGLGVREPETDVAGVLERWVDGIVARVFSHRSLELLARRASIPVVNALSDLEHPCQALGDLLTIRQHKARLTGVGVAFIGDGNNVASSLALACSSVGADFVLASPAGYRVPGSVWEEARRRASETRVEGRVDGQCARSRGRRRRALYGRVDEHGTGGGECGAVHGVRRIQGGRGPLRSRGSRRRVHARHARPQGRGGLRDHARSRPVGRLRPGGKPPPRAEGYSRIALQGALTDQTV